MTAEPGNSRALRRLASRLDYVALALFLLGAFELAAVSHLRFLSNQDANWDFLNYHAYVPAALLDGSWFRDFHPAGIQTYLTPYQDLIQWPLVSAVPAPIATLVLMAVQLSIFVPVGLILRTTVPSLSLWRSLGLGFVGVSGAMAVTELGTTMGDFPPAALMAWALYLLLTLVAGAPANAGRRAAVAGLLVGIAVALKFTVVYLAPGFVVVAACVALARGWRIATTFAAVASAAGVVLYAPWALVLMNSAGSPVFPLFNGLFRAARYPGVDFQDARFPVTSVADLVQLPIRQAQGTAVTAELQFTDARWLLAMILLAACVAVAAWRLARRRGGSPRFGAPVLVLAAFWVVSYVVWARIFGIQRYAILLEVLALPVAVGGISLVSRRLTEGRVALASSIVLAAVLATTTSAIDFGHRPMSSQPLLSRATIAPLDRYDAVVIASPPLAFLSPVTAGSVPRDGRTWLGTPFNDADRTVGKRMVAGKAVGVVFYSFDRATAADAAATLGLRLGDQCTGFESPAPNSLGMRTVVVCPAAPAD